jgi:hypothetical protein
MEALVFFALKTSALASPDVLAHRQLQSNCTGDYSYACEDDLINQFYEQALAEEIGIIVGVIALELIISICVFCFTRANARKRVVEGPMAVMDEGTEFCAVILFGILLGGFLGTLFFLCAMFCGRSKGTAEGQRQLALMGKPAGTIGGPIVVQGYAVSNDSMGQNMKV